MTPCKCPTCKETYQEPDSRLFRTATAKERHIQHTTGFFPIICITCTMVKLGFVKRAAAQ